VFLEHPREVLSPFLEACRLGQCVQDGSKAGTVGECGVEVCAFVSAAGVVVVEESFGFAEGLFLGEVDLEGEGFVEDQYDEVGQALVEGGEVSGFFMGLDVCEAAFLDGFVVEGGEVVFVEFGEDLFQE